MELNKIKIKVNKGRVVINKIPYPELFGFQKIVFDESIKESKIDLKEKIYKRSSDNLKKHNYKFQ